MELIPVQVTPKEAAFMAAFKADFDKKSSDGQVAVVRHHMAISHMHGLIDDAPGPMPVGPKTVDVLGIFALLLMLTVFGLGVWKAFY